MTHLDDGELILYSLGENTPDAGARAHLLTCSQCSGEFAAIERLVTAGRSAGDVELVRPPDSVWHAIHSELGLSPELRDGTVRAQSAQSQSQPAQPDAASVAFDRSSRRRWRGHRRGALTGLLVAASLVVGLFTGAILSGLITVADDPHTLAVAELEPFPGWQASGSARVQEGDSGSRRMVVDVSAPGGELTEVWLIDPETSGLVSLGLLSGESGTFSLPDNLDLSRYSVVDVSREPDDGNPAHSGDSIVRGELAES